MDWCFDDEITLDPNACSMADPVGRLPDPSVAAAGVPADGTVPGRIATNSPSARSSLALQCLTKTRHPDTHRTALPVTTCTAPQAPESRWPVDRADRAPI